MALKPLFDSIVDAIHEKDGLADGIAAVDFPQRIREIPSGFGSGLPQAAPDLAEVYSRTRPADWLPMPMPEDNEMYLLFHIPDGVSSLLAFTVTCTGDYTVETGTVKGEKFVSYGSTTIASNAKYEAVLSADDFGNLTGGGMKQCMVKVHGTDILTWAPSTHGKKSSPANFAGWNIVEIACKLPEGTKVSCGSSTANLALRSLRYFSWYGPNQMAYVRNLFTSCYSLIAILQLDFSQVADMVSMFENCYSLLALPPLNTSKATSAGSLFKNCFSLSAISQLDLSMVNNADNMFEGCYSLASLPPLNTSKISSAASMFNSCYSLSVIQHLDTSSLSNMNNLFRNCYSLTSIPQLDTSKVSGMNTTFSDCFSLAKLTLNPSVENWSGYSFSLTNCSLSHRALVDLLESLPAVTTARTLTLTGNPGASELTDAEKEIASRKNWTLTL